MGIFSQLYSQSLLVELKRDRQLHQELSTEILRVLQTDPDVKELIRQKTMAKYLELVERCKSSDGGAS